MRASRRAVYWLRHREGDTDSDAVRLDAVAVASIAALPETTGDYRSPAGLVGRERDAAARDGWVYFKITPVYKAPS